MTIRVIGAGLAGLLAGNMLRHRDPQLVEQQAALPNNHSAVLRFRTSSIGDVLNIPFRKVTMIKTHVPGHNMIADALLYSFKNTGEMRSDRSITSGPTTADRWIAPSDLIARMANGLHIEYGMLFGFSDQVPGTPIISTLPMSVLMKALNYKPRHEIKFVSTAGLNVKAKIAQCDAYVSLLVPDPKYAFSRISITGDEMIIEIPNFKSTKNTEIFYDAVAMENIKAARELLSIPHDSIYDIKATHQQYAKINPIDDDARKAFIHWASVNYNIYSLGRFATWRPGLLLDDLVQDIRKIDGWLSSNHKYDMARDL